MKKILSLFLATVIVFSLVACSNEQSQDKLKSAENTIAEKGVAKEADNDEEIVAKEDIDENIGKDDGAELEPAIDPDSSVASVSYKEIESKIEEEVETTITALESEMEALSTKVDSYDSYVDNVELITSFYEEIIQTSGRLCIKMCECSIVYAEAILASGKSADDMYDDFEVIYDLIYDSVGDDIYDSIYDGVLDEMYDAFYGGALDDHPDDVKYSDWSDFRSKEYEMWSDARSEVFEQWSDFRSDVYGFWSDIRSEIWSDDKKGALDEIEDFREDVEKMLRKLSNSMVDTAVSEADTAVPEADTATLKADTVTSESEAEDENSSMITDGIRPEFKEAMDSYELFFDEYVKFMKKYKEAKDITSMMSEYSSMMKQYIDTMAALQEIGESELSDKEAFYYAEVMFRISQKLLEAA